MVTYRYRGTTASGAEVTGVVEAFDKQDAVKKARSNCRVLLEVEPVKGGKFDNIMNLDIGDLLGGGKIKAKELALLCSQMAIELKAGLALYQSLKLIAENEKDKKIKKLFTQVAEDVKAGNSLADSFAARGPKLPRTFIETIRAGEESGKLSESFERLSTYYENSAAVASKVGSALIYPALLIVVAIVVIVIIMIKAVPVFEQSFGSADSLPGPTKALIAMSHFLTDNFWILLIVIAVIVAAVLLLKKSDKGSHFFAKLALNFPGLGQVNRMNAASQFASSLSTMLAAGLPLVRALQITSEVVTNLIIGEDVKATSNGVIEGRKMGEGLRKSKYMPSLLIEMSAVGEETGKLEETMEVVNDYYTKEVSNAAARALALLEPIIVIAMAAMVVFILLSVYLPLFGMYGNM